MFCFWIQNGALHKRNSFRDSLSHGQSRNMMTIDPHTHTQHTKRMNIWVKNKTNKQNQADLLCFVEAKLGLPTPLEGKSKSYSSSYSQFPYCFCSQLFCCCCCQVLLSLRKKSRPFLVIQFNYIALWQNIHLSVLNWTVWIIK